MAFTFEEPLTPTQQLCDAACIVNGVEPPNRRKKDPIAAMMEKWAERELEYYSQPNPLFEKFRNMRR